MRYKLFIFQLLLIKEIRAQTELCSIDQTALLNADAALAACQALNGTLWLPITTDDMALRYIRFDTKGFNQGSKSAKIFPERSGAVERSPKK